MKRIMAITTMFAAVAAVAAEPPFKGDAAKAQGIVNQLCVACHGADGQGNPDLKAPKIAGQADWYVVRQLTKFKGGVRAYDPADTAGATMKGIAGTIPDEAAMRDLAAYIHTL